jgi:hypothetical protein
MLGCWLGRVAPGVFFPGAQPQSRARLLIFRGENLVETALKASPTMHTQQHSPALRTDENGSDDCQFPELR